MNKTEYGVCQLSVVPVRKEPTDVSEMVTQLIFGDFLHVLETTENGKWKKIKLAFDGYEGWIDSRQFVSVEKQVYDRAATQVMPYCSSFFWTHQKRNAGLPCVYGK